MNVAQLINFLQKIAPDVEVVVGCEVTYSNNHPTTDIRFDPAIGRVRIIQDSREDIDEWSENNE